MRAGLVSIVVEVNGISDVCELTVNPRRQSNSLLGGGYFLLSADEGTVGKLGRGVLYDFRPPVQVENATTSLMVWDATFDASPAEGLNSYGVYAPWASLVVSDKGWSGAAFYVKPEFGTVDAQRIHTMRDEYALHLALKSTQPEALFTFTLSDGNDEADIVIGPVPDADGVWPARNFARDGQWQELIIPLSDPAFETLFDEPFGGPSAVEGVNLLSFSAGGTQGTQLDMDAVFLYAPEERLTNLSFVTPAMEMEQHTVRKLSFMAVPEEVQPLAVWESLAPDIVAVNDGWISALRPGQAKIVVVSGDLSDTCTVTVTAIPAPNSLNGGDYILLQLGATEWEVVKEVVTCDLRPDERTRKLQIWDNTFTGQAGVDEGVYGTLSNWLRLSVTDKGWSGGAYVVDTLSGTIDLQRIAQNRSDYVLHLALRTNREKAAFTFTMGDGTHTANIVIGNQPNDAGLLPHYDFPHDGQWYELEIPMTLPEFEGLFSADFGGQGTDAVSIFAFSAGGQQGTTIDMDAVFFYRPDASPTMIQLSSTTLTLTEHTVTRLQTTLLPVGSRGRITWSSSNPDIAEINDNVVSALSVGMTPLIATCGNLQAACMVTVTEAPESESLYSLRGSNYFVLQMGDKAFKQVKDKVARDLRPNDAERNLQIWENTFIGQTGATADSYGNYDGWIRMVVSDKGWSGAAYAAYGYPLDMRRIHDNRGDYFFHIALKSNQKQLAYTFTFSDGTNSATIVIGNRPNEAGIWPHYDFARNGTWQEINIPLTLPEFDALYAANIPTTEVNLFAFSAGSERGVALDMDALFFYKRPQEPEELRLSTTKMTLQKQSVQRITATILPAEAYAASIQWESSNPSVALVNDGFVTAVGVGTAQITATCVAAKVVCNVTVTDVKAVNSLHGSGYRVLLMGMGAFEAVSAFNPGLTDLRPDVDGNTLNIWEGTFTARSGNGENSYGHPEDWLQLTVTDKGWSGGAFFSLQKTIDWASMKKRQEYLFHIALKSTQQVSAYTFTFPDKGDTACLVIGNCMGENDVLPSFDFVRDGQWQELNIPLSHSLFDKLFDGHVGAAPREAIDVMTFSAGGERGTILNMDAVFFYKLPVYATDILLDKSEIALSLRDSAMLKATLIPAEAYPGDIVWSSLNPNIAAVDDRGMVTGVGEGMATIVAQSGQHSATCQVSVRRPPAIRLDKTDLSLVVEKEDVLTATWTTPEGTGPISWASSDETIVSVNSTGKVRGLREGRAFVWAFSGEKADTCYVSVVPSPPALTAFSSLQGTDYYIIALGQGPFSMIRANVVQDFRPDDVVAQFHVWENTLEAGRSAGLSSYGITESWTSLAVSEESIGWSGGAYHLTEDFGEVDMTRIAESPASYVFHIALRSRQPATYYLLTFTDTRQEAQVLIGNQAVEGRAPDYDFPRDGQWYELEVPFSVLQAQGLTYDQPFSGAVNILTFISTGIPRTAIDMDAIFFYRKSGTGVTKSPSTDFFLYPLPAQDVIHIGGLNYRTQVRIVDMQGRSVLLQETDGALDVSTLPSGVYLLLVDRQVLRFYKQ
jgi:uncharacterized protein YjdB